MDLRRFFSFPRAILAPMEEVSDAAFRAVCRARGADLCVTEFALADALVAGDPDARRKISLGAGDQPTAIQIYGADARLLAEAAAIAEAAGPAYLDVNCGCWVPKVARGGAGAGWLRDPEAMARMVAMVVRGTSLPVTVKTRIGWGDEARMPIVELARRLEDAGAAAITVHCRTAKMGHDGEADWRWAAQVREVVSIPVVVNGDVRSAADAARALASTGCAAVMIGRRAIEHPWIFREVRARFDRTGPVAPPTAVERIGCCREHLLAIHHEHGPRRAVRAMRRYYAGYLSGVPDAAILRRALERTPTLDGTLALLDEARLDAEPAAA